MDKYEVIIAALVLVSIFLGCRYIIKARREKKWEKKLLSSNEPGFQWAGLVKKNIRAGKLSKEGRVQEALKVYSEIEQQFSRSTDEAVLGEVAKAIFKRGGVYWHMEEYEKALEETEKLEAWYGNVVSEDAEIWIARNILEQGNLYFQKKGKKDEARERYHKMIQRYEASENPEIREVAIVAVLNLTDLEMEDGKAAKAIEIIGKAREACKEECMEVVCQKIPYLYLNLSKGYLMMGDGDKALDALKEMVLRFEKSEDAETVDNVCAVVSEIIDILLEQDQEEYVDAFFDSMDTNKELLLGNKIGYGLAKANRFEEKGDEENAYVEYRKLLEEHVSLKYPEEVAIGVLATYGPIFCDWVNSREEIEEWKVKLFLCFKEQCDMMEGPEFDYFKAYIRYALACVKYNAGKTYESEEYYKEVVDSYAGNTEPEIKEMVKESRRRLKQM